MKIINATKNAVLIIRGALGIDEQKLVEAGDTAVSYVTRLNPLGGIPQLRY